MGYPVLNWFNKAHPVTCERTIESVEISNSFSGTGGIATSITKLKIHTEDCATVYIGRTATSSFHGSWQSMVDEVNKNQR